MFAPTCCVAPKGNRLYPYATVLLVDTGWHRTATLLPPRGQHMVGATTGNSDAEMALSSPYFPKKGASDQRPKLSAAEREVLETLEK